MTEGQTTDQLADHPGGHGARFRRRRALAGPLREVVWAALAVVAALGALAVTTRLWNMSLHVPLAMGQDNTFGLALAKTLLTHPWLGVNGDFGAPYGSVLYDFTSTFGDFTQLLTLKTLGVVMTSPSAVVNTFYLLGYVSVPVVTYAVLRALGFGPGVSAACAVIYTVLPFHLLRGRIHLMLAAYYAVPVSGVLILGLMGRVTLFVRRPGVSGWRAWLSRRSLLTVAAIVFAGSSGAYYALFTVAIGAPLGVLFAIARGSWRQLVPVGIVCGGVLAVMVAAQAPTIAYHALKSPAPEIAQRSPWESELYGLKIASLLLPLPDHRVDAVGRWSSKYYTVTQLNGEGASAALGATLSFALLIGLVLAVSAALGRSILSRRWLLARDASVAALLTTLLGTVGGGSALLAYFVSPQIRGWNRISVFVAFFALVVLASLLSAAGERWRARGGPAWALGVGLAGVVGLAAFDQVPSSPIPYRENLAEWQTQARFGAAVDEALPDGTMVLQLPYVPWPENPPVNEMIDYDHFRGYIHTNGLRWSYGASKSRYPQDWAATSAELPTGDLVRAAAAAGFGAVWVDRAGYADRGEAIVRGVSRVAGGPLRLGFNDGRTEVFDLRPLAAAQQATLAPRQRAAARLALLKPLAVTWGDGIGGPETDGKTAYRWLGRSGTIALSNRSGQTQRVTVSMRVLTNGPALSLVTLRGPGTRARLVKVRGTGDGRLLETTVAVPAGQTRLRLTTTSPDEGVDPRDLRARLFAPQIRNAALSDLRPTNIAAQ